MNEQKDKCIHHWIYEFPNGPTSLGICCRCGERDEGRRNSFDENVKFSVRNRHMFAYKTRWTTKKNKKGCVICHSSDVIEIPSARLCHDCGFTDDYSD